MEGQHDWTAPASLLRLCDEARDTGGRSGSSSESDDSGSAADAGVAGGMWWSGGGGGDLITHHAVSPDDGETNNHRAGIAAMGQQRLPRRNHANCTYPAIPRALAARCGTPIPPTLCVLWRCGRSTTLPTVHQRMLRHILGATCLCAAFCSQGTLNDVLARCYAGSRPPKLS